MFSVVSVQFLIISWVPLKNTVIEGTDSGLGIERKKAMVYSRAEPWKLHAA